MSSPHERRDSDLVVQIYFVNILVQLKGIIFRPHLKSVVSLFVGSLSEKRCVPIQTHEMTKKEQDFEKKDKNRNKNKFVDW